MAFHFRPQPVWLNSLSTVTCGTVSSRNVLRPQRAVAPKMRPRCSYCVQPSNGHGWLDDVLGRAPLFFRIWHSCVATAFTSLRHTLSTPSSSLLLQMSDWHGFRESEGANKYSSNIVWVVLALLLTERSSLEQGPGQVWQLKALILKNWHCEHQTHSAANWINSKDGK